MLLRVVPETIHLRQAEHRLVAMHAVKHEHAESARLQVHWSTAKRLRTPGARLGRFFGCPLREFRMRLSNIINVPVRRRRSIGRQLRIAWVVITEWHCFGLAALRKGALHKAEIIKMSAQHRW